MAKTADQQAAEPVELTADEKALQEQEAAEKARLSTTIKYRVLRPLEHDLIRFGLNELISLTGKQADPHVASGAITPAMKEVPIK